MEANKIGADASKAFSDNRNVKAVDVKLSVNPPTNILAEPIDASSVSISWTAPAVPVDHFNIYRSLSVDGQYILIGQAANTEYRDSGLSTSTTYYYKIVSVTENATSIQAGPVSATTFAEQGGTITANALNCTCVQLDWTVTEQYNSFKIYRALQETGQFQLVATTAGTARRFIDCGLIPNETYIYRLEGQATTGIILGPVSVSTPTCSCCCCCEPCCCMPCCDPCRFKSSELCCCPQTQRYDPCCCNCHSYTYCLASCCNYCCCQPLNCCSSNGRRARF